MSKIVLTNIHLVNWYGFINTTIPIGANLTLITGENECGKSTILDAVKYAFTGDFEFNKSSATHNIGGSKRTLYSYTRCLIDASAGNFARPADKQPNVYSHISLEYYDEVNRHYFVLGVILETNVSNNVSSYWYAMDHTMMRDIQYTYEDQGIQKPYDYQKFQKRYGIQMMSRKEALIKFMQMTGLKLAYAEINKFQRKLRSIMTYNPAAKIQEFIKESVLESHDINFDKLRDAKNNIEKINTTLQLIQEEVRALDAILKDFSEHEKISSRLAVDDAKRIYKDKKKLEETIGINEAEIQKNTIELGHLNTSILDVTQKKSTMEDSYLKAKANLAELDCSKAIEDEEQKLSNYLYQQKKLGEQKQELAVFKEKISEILAILNLADTQSEISNTLLQIDSSEYSPVEKESAVNHLKAVLSEKKNDLIEQRVEIRKQLQDVQAEINHYNSVIEECNKNKPDYSFVREQLSLIGEINREFKKNNIEAKAKFACEFVVGIVDEEWREAIEAFLGIHRYSIIVEPKYFDLANRVLDNSSHKYVELVNTKLLSRKESKCEEDAVLNQLIIKNEIAQKYFAFWLGRIHAVPMTDVPKYENAMSKEGKLARNMAVTFINTKKVKTFCLGQETIELNKKRAMKQVLELETKEKQFLAEKEKNDHNIRSAEAYLEYFKSYNYSAYQEYAAITKQINEVKENLKNLIAAQKNNMEYQTLSIRVQELNEELLELHKLLDKSNTRKTKLELANEQYKRNISEFEQKRKIKEEALEEQRLLHTAQVRTAIQEYDDFVAKISVDGDVMKPATRERGDRRKRELEGLIIGGQKDYNRRKKEEERLPEGLLCEGKYLARKNKIWVDDLQDINAKMAEQTRKYESIFKNEFVLSLYQTALGAKEDISAINKELRKLQFATKYQFDVNLLDDKSEYAKILRYAEFLKKTNKVDDGQMVFGNLYGYEDDEVALREKEIKEIINRIIDKNDIGVIKAFADYRNYMSYEIIINNVDVKDGKLSKQAGYNSGAGTQIPYTLILSAALSMLYNARINSVRLLFIDEPFEKMSDHNIKLMLDFFKSQNFQVIFCAPPNKTDSIGYECDTIIPVIKIRNDNMQIGSVQFYEEGKRKGLRTGDTSQAG